MSPFVTAVAKLLAILTLATDIGILLFLTSAVLALFVKPLRKSRDRLLRSLVPYARIFAFSVALTATSGSLFFSEVAKFTPCLLCWWQRIFMYPQTLLLALGIIKNDKNIADYALGLSLVGAAIALYHYFIQFGGTKIIPCEVVGYSVSCNQRFSLEFGYITIPMMSLSAFSAIILLMYLTKRYQSK